VHQVDPGVDQGVVQRHDLVAAQVEQVPRAGRRERGGEQLGSDQWGVPGQGVSGVTARPSLQCPPVEQPRPLTPGKIGQLLLASGKALCDELVALPPEVASWHPAPGEWCALEVVGHVLEAEERGFAGRIRGLLAGQPIESWDQEAKARERRDCERSGYELARELWRTRWANVGMVERLRADDLARGAEHPAIGRLAIGDLLQEWVYHDRDHMRQLYAVVQAYHWPHMGATQRFYSPSS
jgi:hypothetical protein